MIEFPGLLVALHDLAVEFGDEQGDAVGVGVRVLGEELSGALFCLVFLSDVPAEFVVEPFARVPHPRDSNTTPDAVRRLALLSAFHEAPCRIVFVYVSGDPRVHSEVLYGG